MADPTGPESIEAVAQSRGTEGGIPDTEQHGREEGEGTSFWISHRVEWAFATRLYERQSDDPVYRPLKIFALDPATSRLEGGLAATKVPYERLEPGPRGSIVEVSNEDASGEYWRQADLDHTKVLMEGGYTPSLSDPRFHQQMVYAVAMMTYATFKVALGRNIAWAFGPEPGGEQRARLVLRPHGAVEANAWYDRDRREVVFGYFQARASTSVAQKGKTYVFTALSHDIIAHEMTHALLDGLRAHFLLPTHRDVLAFHEAFADLVAFFQHFTFEETVRAELSKARGDLEIAEALVNLAREFGEGLGTGKALRSFLDLTPELTGKQAEPLTYDAAKTEPHELGKVLARAMFSAFLTIYRRRSARYIKLATNGSGVLPEGDLAPGLIDFLVSEVRRLASQFLSICIRAIDYCPPVDVRFGDFLQAVVTADRDLVPDDDLAYREAIIRAFGARGIYGEGTRSMTEDALAWGGPRMPINEPALSFGEMHLDGDPAAPVDPSEMRRQAAVLGRLAMRPEFASEFGLVSVDSPAFREGHYMLPTVESIRPARRVGPDQQIAFDTVAEIVQCRHVIDGRGRRFRFYGGATVIISPRGEVRFVIRKRVDKEERVAEQIAFMDGNRFWQDDGTELRPVQSLSLQLCRQS